MMQRTEEFREAGWSHRLPPIYLLLLAVYPVLALAAANPHQGIRSVDLAFPTVAAIWFAFVSWTAAGLLTRDSYKRSMVAIIWIIWFAGYGYFTPLLAPVARSLHAALDSVGIPATFAVGVGVSIWVLRTGHTFTEASKVLRATSWILIVLPVLTHFSRGPRTGLAATWEPGSLPAVSSTVANRPDIYFIVLDTYTGTQSLKRNFGFDNSPFEDQLKARGFFVPQDSRSNYVSTFLALATMLNWTYFDDLPVGFEDQGNDQSYPGAMIEDNRAVRFLKAAGYQFLFLPSSYPHTTANRHADRVLAPRGAGPAAYPEFLVAWVETTPARPLIQVMCLLARCRTDQLPFQPESGERIRWKFDLLGDLGRQPGPKFVFAHLIVPHPPYVLEQDCSPKPRALLFATDSATDRKVRAEYVAQVQCVNRLVIELVDRLKRDAAEPPVIVLQADHGHGRFPGVHNPPPIDEADPEGVRERTDIFAAYHMPGVGAQLYDSITPANVFPVMFRHYFGASIPAVEDRTYYSSHSAPYRFTRLR